MIIHYVIGAEGRTYPQLEDGYYVNVMFSFFHVKKMKPVKKRLVKIMKSIKEKEKDK